MTGSKTGIDVRNEWQASQLPVFVGATNDTWDAYDLIEAVSLLSSLSLITTTEQDGATMLSMHPLIHAWAGDRQSHASRKSSWLKAGCVITLAACDLSERAQVERPVQAHIQTWVDEKIDTGILCGELSDVMVLVWSCSWMLVQMRDDARLELLLEAVFRELELDRTQPTGSMVPIYHLQAQSHCLNGKWKEGVELMKSVVRIRQETLERRHGNKLSAEHLLGVAYLANGQMKEAMEQLEHVAKVRETTLAETHPSRLASQHVLAGVYSANGQMKEAVALLEHVVKVEETTLAETHPDRLASQLALALEYQADGQMQNAMVLLEHVVAVEARFLGDDFSVSIA
jgi:tetratricopeptide (TPR) repeat protein